MESRPIRLVLVDDHPGVRRGIKGILRSAKDIAIIGEGENAADALSLALSNEPDIILMDVELPDERGYVAMRRILEKLPNVKFLAISAYQDRQYILDMLANGASGYITKDEVPSTLLKAIRKIILDGKNWISAHNMNKISKSQSSQMTLTRAELNILEQLAHDKSESAIAEALDMEEIQVKKFLDLLMKKYRVDSISALKVIGRQRFSDLMSG